MFQRGFMPMPMYMSNMAPGFMGLGRGGLFRSLRGGTSLFRGINWGSLFNNASRALGVVNQAIPLVKQAGPMFNNMKSMLKLASIFKDETDDDYRKNKDKTTVNNNNIDKEDKTITLDNDSNTQILNYNNQPNFFI